jgi:hypothetical protein
MPFTSDQLADRRHDSRKTIDVLPAGADATVVATLVRSKTTDFNDAVWLIDEYAQQAVRHALEDLHLNSMIALDAPMTSSLP